MTVVVSDRQAKTVADGAGRKGWPLAGSRTAYPMDVAASGGVELVGLERFARYDMLYRSQHWVATVVNKLARGIARLPAKSYLLDPDSGERERLRAHPLPVLLSRPYPRGSAFALWSSTVGSLCLYGNALWWKFKPKAGMAPVELWPLDWRLITIRTGTNAPIDHYELRGPGGSRRFLPDEVVHFQWWSPDGLAGQSPLEPLARTLALEDAGQRYAISSFRNAARPAGAIVGGNLNERQRAELRGEIQAVHEGPDNAFRMAILSGLGGATWQPFAHTSQEAETIDHRRLNREEICAAFDVPPPMVGILDHATFSNIDEQHRMLYQDTLGPWLTMLEETLGAQLLWGEPDYANAFVEFDLGEVLKADIEKRSAAYAAMRSAGILTANEGRDRENLERVDHPAADAILIPLNMEPVGEGDLGVAPRAQDVPAVVQPNPPAPVNDEAAP